MVLFQNLHLLLIIFITSIFIYTRSSTAPLSSVCWWTSCHRYLSQVASFHTIYSCLSHYQIHEEVMVRWQDGIGDSHQPAFSCDHDLFYFSLVLVPSLPVSLLCVASLLRWYSLDNFAGFVIIGGWKAKRNILNNFKTEDMKKSVLIPAAFLVGTLGWCQPALPTYQRYLQEKIDLWVYRPKEDLNLKTPVKLLILSIPHICHFFYTGKIFGE